MDALLEAVDVASTPVDDEQQIVPLGPTGFSSSSVASRRRYQNRKPSPSSSPATPRTFARGFLERAGKVPDVGLPSSDDERPAPRPRSSAPYRRPAAEHNQVEKERRAFLTECYSALRMELPALCAKASNAAILDAAAAEVVLLQKEEQRLLSELTAARINNERRVRTVRQQPMKRAKSSALLRVTEAHYSEFHPDENDVHSVPGSPTHLLPWSGSPTTYEEFVSTSTPSSPRMKEFPPSFPSPAGSSAAKRRRSLGSSGLMLLADLLNFSAGANSEAAPMSPRTIAATFALA